MANSHPAPKKQVAPSSEEQSTTPIRCGIVMPISGGAECSAEHWIAVLAMIKDALIPEGFWPELVSDGKDAGVIQARIVENLYNSPIVVCDVSTKNANVMFELGMRFAFDKRAVVIKDDLTDYSFDMSPFEHVGYPRTLHYPSVKLFQKRLVEKVKATYDLSKQDVSPYLRAFGPYKPAELKSQTLPEGEFILKKLDLLEKLIYDRTNPDPIKSPLYTKWKIEKPPLWSSDPDLRRKKITELAEPLIGTVFNNISDISELSDEDLMMAVVNIHAMLQTMYPEMQITAREIFDITTNQGRTISVTGTSNPYLINWMKSLNL